MTLDEAKKIYPKLLAIYHDAADLPAGYAVREWYGLEPGELLGAGLDLSHARWIAWESGGTYKLPRDPKDDPVIVESWI
jgi:hypothetical protein